MFRLGKFWIALVLLLCGVAHAVSGSGDTPAGRLDTRAPDFSATEVVPAETLGEELLIRVRADEALADPPLVEVNARPTQLLPSTTYDFLFLLTPGDRFRPGDLYLEGTDLVGNTASLHRTITVLAPLPVPLHPYAAVAVLLAAGVAVLRWRRRGIPTVLLALALAASAQAEHPAVTNATFMQRATATGTEIIITFDLTAPNGPCDITVRLSKDGGIDGYPHAVTSLSGDLNGVVDGPGHSITWNVSADYPNEDLPNASLRITADDGQPEFTVQYLAGTGGSISGEATQAVVLHKDAAPVTAVADLNYHFTGWSDGVSTATRTDLDITGDLSVTANFATNLVEMVAVAAGSFPMGRTSAGDDATFGGSTELPVHTVQLSAYQIGKFEVTNEQFCTVLNWAHARQLLRTSTNAEWAGSGNIFAGSPVKSIQTFTSGETTITFTGGQFVPATRRANAGTISIATHPIAHVSWYGGALFCNWLSEMEGMTPVYSPTDWSATLANSGYRLPTEAQWERAAAWDGNKHWTFAFSSDYYGETKRATHKCTPGFLGTIYTNPLGLRLAPLTSPVGWFNGVNGTTLDSPSPVGCYDMTGNLNEFCHDFFSSTYYSVSPAADPAGPATGTNRVVRGGHWETSSVGSIRTAWRAAGLGAGRFAGFRIAR